MLAAFFAVIEPPAMIPIRSPARSTRDLMRGAPGLPFRLRRS